MSKRVRKVIVASLLTAFAVYTSVVIVVAIMSGRTHGRYFWPTAVVLSFLAAWAGRRALVLWRGFRRPLV